MANDNATSPVGCYQQTSGTLIDSLTSDIGIGSEIRGVTCETGTDSPYLWVSNQTTDELYRIDLYTEANDDDESEPVLPYPHLSLSSNPFYSSVMITGSGFSNTSVLEIHDLSGRRIESSSFSGTYSWNAVGLPAGAYIVTVSDFEGRRKFLKLLKL
ncbi:MAG: T9SS type A sorting domain-containing protein [Candidatus Sabulitectum sp.]|nr:T9SS type A sorting domain-containing protein [Candidatus Sabulitectum sp.]